MTETIAKNLDVTDRVEDRSESASTSEARNAPAKKNLFGWLATSAAVIVGTVGFANDVFSIRSHGFGIFDKSDRQELVDDEPPEADDLKAAQFDSTYLTANDSPKSMWRQAAPLRTLFEGKKIRPATWVGEVKSSSAASGVVEVELSNRRGTALVLKHNLKHIPSEGEYVEITGEIYSAKSFGTFVNDGKLRYSAKPKMKVDPLYKKKICVQNELSRLDLYSSAVDGVFGEVTRKAHDNLKERTKDVGIPFAELSNASELCSQLENFEWSQVSKKREDALLSSLPDDYPKNFPNFAPEALEAAVADSESYQKAKALGRDQLFWDYIRATHLKSFKPDTIDYMKNLEARKFRVTASAQRLGASGSFSLNTRDYVFKSEDNEFLLNVDIEFASDGITNAKHLHATSNCLDWKIMDACKDNGICTRDQLVTFLNLPRTRWYTGCNSFRRANSEEKELCDVAANYINSKIDLKGVGQLTKISQDNGYSTDIVCRMHYSRDKF